ncbi:MAG TPA: hypothetical protein VMJ32_03335 [Pirellulales bacterium]|nr:hypothetical protein [Pirellulales bacterium]
MSTRTITNSWWWWVIGAAAVVWALAASVAGAATKVPVHTADQPIVHPSDIGPSDAPVRNAILTQQDRTEIKVQPARWWYGGYYGYVPSYAYYPGPYVSYYPRYYSSYYYPAPYTTYYAPTYYSAAPGPYYPYYSAAPVYAAPVYRFPRRAFVGAYYW